MVLAENGAQVLWADLDWVNNPEAACHLGQTEKYNRDRWRVADLRGVTFAGPDVSCSYRLESETGQPMSRAEHDRTAKLLLGRSSAFWQL
jgi:hypothetical protein